MVTKKEEQNQLLPPSHIDEGWWESVLSDEIEDPTAAQADTHAAAIEYLAPASDSRHRHEFGSTPNGTHTPLKESVEDDYEDDEYEPDEIAGDWSHPVDQVDWDKACHLYEQDLATLLKVNGYNRGGVLVGGDGLQGFVPISHLIDIPCANDETDDWLEDYVDRSLFVKVIECDPERSRIVFSERAALSEPGSRIHLMNRLKTGDCVRGEITNITDFGAFVDLGGVEGLIHVSEMSWGRVHHPSDIIQLNQKVDVYVIQIDRQKARVALSMKRLYPNPWESAAERYYPGLETEAVITSVVPFGAFARLEDGLDGLIHISEIKLDKNSPKRIPLQEGQQVSVRVLHVDCDRQRLGLSLKLHNML